MHLDISSVEFSNGDIKNKVVIPKELNSELAYFIGIHFGDGSMIYDKNKRSYYLGYSGHITDEYKFYVEDISLLIKKLFNKKVRVCEDRRPKRRSIKVYFYSKAVLTFLHKVIKLPIGPKKEAGIPVCIKKFKP